MDLDGVFLDLYGTLTSGDRAAVESVCANLVRDHPITMSAHELSVTWGERFFHALDFANDAAFMTLFELECRTLVDVMTQLGVELDPTPYVRRLSAYWREPPLQPDVDGFLRRMPVPICIVSNADRADAESALALHGIDVDRLVTSEDARSYKPAPRIFEQALQRTGWRRDRVIHVGDSLHSDVGGALAAGLRSGWLNRAGRIHDIGTHTPHHEFADLCALAQWVADAGPAPADLTDARTCPNMSALDSPGGPPRDRAKPGV